MIRLFAVPQLFVQQCIYYEPCFLPGSLEFEKRVLGREGLCDHPPGKTRDLGASDGLLWAEPLQTVAVLFTAGEVHHVTFHTESPGRLRSVSPDSTCVIPLPRGCEPCCVTVTSLSHCVTIC